MATQHRTFRFPAGDIDGIVDEMRVFAADADGRRWMNIVPDADENEIHTGSVFWRAFTSRGPVIPQLTWFPAHESRQGRVATEVGLAHATGKRALERLADHGVTTPTGWTATQDHQKRGILWGLAETADDRSVVELAVAALPVLAPFGFEPAFLATFSRQ